ncbi:MAG TPA: hypothetical protein VKA84_27960 [Gemmatimonadaceae bacterium]|nr:hypothetical protein [Gemmatimonadaceae bacterium]
MRAILYIALVAAAGVAGVAEAQAAAPRAAPGAPAVSPGERVRVWTRDRSYPPLRRAGPLIALTGDSVVLTYELARRRLALPLDSVQRLDVSLGRAPTAHRARVGAVAGGVVGGLVGVAAGLTYVALCESDSCRRRSLLAWGASALGGAAVGAAGGAAVAAALPGAERWEPVTLPRQR